MLRLSLFVACCLAVAVLSGCNTLAGQPQISHASIEPDILEPGASAVIALEIKDRHRSVQRIEGVVLEDPRIAFLLRDDGIAPDEEAGDGVWSMQVDVPFQAPPGEFTLEFTAYGPDGLPVSVRDDQGRTRSGRSGQYDTDAGCGCAGI